MWSSVGCTTFQAERGMEEVIWLRRQCEREETIMPGQEGARGGSRGNMGKCMAWISRGTFRNQAEA